MSNAQQRARWLSIYGALYVRFGFRRDDLGDLARLQACAYCGNMAQSEDHIPPLKWMYALGSDHFRKRKILCILVPACRECNSSLSDRKIFNLKDRCAYLLGRYSRKYRRFLRGQKWRQEELDELGRNLRDYVTNFATCQLGIDRRVQILEEGVRRS